MNELPATLFNFATHNEDAAVEMLLIDALGADAESPLRVLAVAGCGTNVLTICASPDVGRVDAVDVAPAQLQLAGLTRSAVEALETPEDLAVFLGNDGDPGQRRELYRLVRERTGPALGQYWDDNIATIEAGLIRCGGAERCQARTRAHLPTDDLTLLAQDPAAVRAAFKEGMSLSAIEQNIVGMPMPMMQALAEKGVPRIAAQANERLRDVSEGDFLLELTLRGRFPMEPIDTRPLFLQPHTYAAIRQNGCGPDRIAFHLGPLQAVGPDLAKQHGVYDLVDMSNILDMTPPDKAPLVVDGIKSALRPGAIMVCRSYGEPGPLAELFRASGLTIEETLGRRALSAESSYFIHDVCVATV